jgi:hypothetical protein
MIFAVAMMFVDQTIVAIAVPYIQRGTIGAAGFVLWGNHLHDPFSDQWYWIVLAGAGIELALTPVSTDSVNRAPRGSYGEVTGISQTVRYPVTEQPPGDEPATAPVV